MAYEARSLRDSRQRFLSAMEAVLGTVFELGPTLENQERSQAAKITASNSGWAAAELDRLISLRLEEIDDSAFRDSLNPTFVQAIFSAALNLVRSGHPTAAAFLVDLVQRQVSQTRRRACRIFLVQVQA